MAFCDPLFAGEETFPQPLRATVTIDLIQFFASLPPIWIDRFGVAPLGFTLLFSQHMHTHTHTVSFSTPRPPPYFPLIDGCRLSPLIQPLAAFKTLLMGAQRTTSAVFLSLFSFNLAAFNGSLEDHCICVCVCVMEREQERESRPAVKCANRLAQPDVAVSHGQCFHLHPAALVPDGSSSSLLEEK